VPDFRDLLRDPLVHFIVAGAAIFAGYAWIGPAETAPAASAPIRIGSGEMRWLNETFTSQWRRPPTSVEIDRLVAGLVEEELLAREARSLGLDREDTVVRRRLVQKMDFMLAETARLAVPTDADLKDYLDRNPALIAPRRRITLEQIYFARGKDRDPESAARTALAGLAVEPDRPVEGDRLLVDADLSDVDGATLASLFGPGFASAVAKVARGSWTGPIASAYGLHLVRVHEKPVDPAAEFAAIRNELIAGWQAEQTTRMRADYLERLRAKFGVVIETASAATQTGAAGR
jgi:hypothetical protein